jgi:steroid 5-alpha reductase family enzyme
MGKLILGLETLPWNILYRVAIGYGVMPAAMAVYGATPTLSQLLLAFLVILVSLRVVPGMLRRFMPVGRDVKNVWAERRALAKRYDSYQWQKLFGIGVGWAAYLFLHKRTSGAPVALAGACVVAGAIGLMFWLRVSRVLAGQTVSTTPV